MDKNIAEKSSTSGKKLPKEQKEGAAAAVAAAAEEAAALKALTASLNSDPGKLSLYQVSFYPLSSVRCSLIE